jgi:lysophospholipase L1-like esterase
MPMNAPKDSPSPNGWSGAAGKILLVLMSLAFVILVPERIFRILVTSERGADNAYGTRFDFVLSPYLMFAEPDTRHGGSLNSQGFQGPELPKDRPANEVRIAVLGGSAVYNGGTTNSIAAHLERILSGRYPAKKIRVINFGRASYISMQELILLQRNVLSLSPNLIIVYDGFNDIWVPYSDKKNVSEPVGYPFLYSNLVARVERNRFVNFDVISRYLASRSALYNYLLNALRKKMTLKQRSLDIGELEAEYRRNLGQMCALARAGGAKILLATQPYIGAKGSKGPKEAELEKQYLNGTDVKNMQEYFRKLSEVAREVADRNGSHYIDFLDVFDGMKEDVFIDLVHVKMDIAHPIIARRFADGIVRRKLLSER